MPNNFCAPKVPAELRDLRNQAVDIFTRHRCTQCHSSNPAVSLSDIGTLAVFGDLDQNYRPTPAWIARMDQTLRGHGTRIMNSVNRSANDPKRMPFYGSTLSAPEKAVLKRYFDAIEGR